MLNNLSDLLKMFKDIYEKLDYFSSGDSTSPFLHFWSLSIEEQFYFFYPLLFLSFYSNSKIRKILVMGLSWAKILIYLV